MGIKNLKLIDYIVIIIQFGYHLSILSSFVMMPYHIGIVAFMLLAYLIRFKRMVDPFKFIFSSRLFVIFLIICLFDIVQFLVTDIGLGLGKFVMTINFIVFANYLNELYNSLPINKKDEVLKPFVVYGVYNVIAIVIAAILIFLGVLSANSNPVAFSLMEDNLSNGSNYFFPGYLSIAIDVNRVLANIPVLTGLSHEPHVICFLVLPVVFLLIGKVKSLYGRFVIYALTGVILVVSMSTTAIFSFIIVLFVELIWSFGRTGKVSNIILLALVLFLSATYFIEVLTDTQLFMMNKIDTDTGSLNYSENLLKYVVTPKGFLGTGNKGVGNFFEGADSQIGFVTSFLDVLFYILIAVKTIKMVYSRDNITHYVGMACMYFAIHLLKVSFLVFNYPYLVFIMFIIERFTPNTRNIPSISQQNANYVR